MRLVLCATLGAALALGGASRSGGAAAPRPGSVDRAPADTVALASRLAGTWRGEGVDSGSTTPQRFTMRWRQAQDGHPTGTVSLAGGPEYPVNVVWSSDTAFIYVSAPHRSPTLREEVVTRTLARFKGDSLVGTYEARPTKYSPKSLTGRFSAVRGS